MELTNVLSSVGDVVSAVVTSCTSNPVTMVIIGMGVVGIGVGLFKKLLKAGK